MSSWVVVLLLAALAAARLRFVRAEQLKGGIISTESLLLLESDSVEETEEGESVIQSNETRARFTRSLVDAQPAQQAVCKVRAEVMEITRAMLDRRNANFLLWPPCVEVQRCSGCCNTRLLQCVPTLTHTRYLQVTKIQYINRRAHYEKAVISVEDHAACRCQTISSASPSRSLPRQDPPPPPPHKPSVSLPAKTHAKEDLHRHDDLKQNQRLLVEEREQLERRWQHRYVPEEPGTQAGGDVHPPAHAQSGGHTPAHAQSGVHTPAHAQSGVHTPAHAQSGVHTPTYTGAEIYTPTHPQAGVHPPTHTRVEVDSPAHARPWHEGRGAEHAPQWGVSQLPRDGGARESPLGSGYEVGATGERPSHTLPSHGAVETLTQEQQQQQQYEEQQRQYQQQPQQQYHQRYQQSHPPITVDQEVRSPYRHHTLQSDSAAAPPGNPEQPTNQGKEPDQALAEPTNQKDSNTKVANEGEDGGKELSNQRQTDTETTNQKQGNGEAGHRTKEVPGLKNKETKLTNPEHRESEPTNQEPSLFTEEERREKLMEIVQGEPDSQSGSSFQPSLPKPDHHHPHQKLNLHPQAEMTTHKAVVPTGAPTAPRPPSTPLASRPRNTPLAPGGPNRTSGPRPFRPAGARRRRKHRARISKAAIRAMIM